MNRRAADDMGASSVEYGLIVFAIAALVVIVLFAFGGAVQGMFTHTCDRMNGQTASGTCTS